MKHSNNGRHSKGFSLIELIVVIAIIGIIAAVAIPSYTSYMLKAKRIDAVSFLTEVAGEQVRFFSEYNRYGKTMKELGYGDADTADSEEGYYTISIATANNDASYVLSATPVTGGPQANDTECGTLTLSSSGVKTESGTAAAAAECW